MIFHWNWSDSKSPQTSMTLLSILAALNNAVVWMTSTRPIISKSSSPYTNPLGIVPSVPITIGIIVTFMFHSFFFSSLARSRFLSLFSLSSSFTLWSTGMAKSTIRQVIIIIIIIYSLRVFHRSVSRWLLTGVWVTASHFKSTGLFSVFWPISIMQ